MVVAILAIILTLILVIGIHEAGHAVVAGLFKIKIHRIAIGFGRPLMKWQTKNGCEWVWGMWLLGGYVQLANTRIIPVEPKEQNRCFDKKPIWQRILVLLAGAFANFITALLAFTLVFYLGLTYRIPQIQTVQPNSIAAKAGILPGEQFIAVAGRPTVSWQEVGAELIIAWGESNIVVTVAQPNSTQLKKITLDLSKIQFNSHNRSLLASLGIAPNLTAPKEHVRASSLAAAMVQAKDAIIHFFYFFIMIIKQLFSGIIPFSVLLGPLGLFSASVASLTQGIVVFLYFIASLSVAVGFVNLLPLPGLDGGSILYAVIEKIRGKPISVALEVLIHRLMMIVAFIVLAHLLSNDLTRMAVSS